MAGIPLVDLSEPLSRGICSNPRLVGLTSGENRPGDAGEFVGERDRQHVAVQPLRCLLDSGPQTSHCCARPPHQNDVCGLHEQCSHVFVATFGDLAQDRAIPCRLLLRHQPQLGAEVTSLLEASAVANRRHQGTRDNRTDTRNSHQSLAAVVL